ncbi:unnamed protein product [Meganyctiphanes norvegica]|uniref:Matrin-type domain-containing protein n=1 Tax=Meganyctiphanes norvegica TaxID=48144 RepID=A0AAV2PJ57_MEGNR
MVTVAMEEKQDETPNDRNKCEATMKIFGSMSSMKKWYSVGEEGSSSSSCSSGHDSTSSGAKITLKKLTPFNARKTLKKIDTGQGDRSTLPHNQSSSQPPMMPTTEPLLINFDFEKASKCGMVTLEERGNQKIYRCNICKLTCTGQKPISDHLEGQKHKKNLKMFPSKVSEYLAAIDNVLVNKSPITNATEVIKNQSPVHERKYPENNIRENIEPSSSQISDEIADEMSIKLIVDLDTALRIGIVSVDAEKKIYSCNVCNLTSHGPKPMCEHIEGQRHKKSLRNCPTKVQEYLDALQHSSSRTKFPSYENQLRKSDESKTTGQEEESKTDRQEEESKIARKEEKQTTEESSDSLLHHSSTNIQEVKESKKETGNYENSSPEQKQKEREVISTEENTTILLSEPKANSSSEENLALDFEDIKQKQKEKEVISTEENNSKLLLEPKVNLSSEECLGLDSEYIKQKQEEKEIISTEENNSKLLSEPKANSSSEENIELDSEDKQKSFRENSEVQIKCQKILIDYNEDTKNIKHLEKEHNKDFDLEEESKISKPEELQKSDVHTPVDKKVKHNAIYSEMERDCEQSSKEIGTYKVANIPEIESVNKQAPNPSVLSKIDKEENEPQSSKMQLGNAIFKSNLTEYDLLTKPEEIKINEVILKEEKCSKELTKDIEKTKVYFEQSSCFQKSPEIIEKTDETEETKSSKLQSSISINIAILPTIAETSKILKENLDSSVTIVEKQRESAEVSCSRNPEGWNENSIPISPTQSAIISENIQHSELISQAYDTLQHVKQPPTKIELAMINKQASTEGAEKFEYQSTSLENLRNKNENSEKSPEEMEQFKSMTENLNISEDQQQLEEIQNTMPERKCLEAPSEEKQCYSSNTVVDCAVEEPESSNVVVKEVKDPLEKAKPATIMQQESTEGNQNIALQGESLEKLEDKTENIEKSPVGIQQLKSLSKNVNISEEEQQLEKIQMSAPKVKTNLEASSEDRENFTSDPVVEQNKFSEKVVEKVLASEIAPETESLPEINLEDKQGSKMVLEENCDEVVVKHAQSSQIKRDKLKHFEILKDYTNAVESISTEEESFKTIVGETEIDKMLLDEAAGAETNEVAESSQMETKELVGTEMLSKYATSSSEQSLQGLKTTEGTTEKVTSFESKTELIKSLNVIVEKKVSPELTTNDADILKIKTKELTKMIPKQIVSSGMLLGDIQKSQPYSENVDDSEGNVTISDETNTFEKLGKLNDIVIKQTTYNEKLSEHKQNPELLTNLMESSLDIHQQEDCPVLVSEKNKNYEMTDHSEDSPEHEQITHGMTSKTEMSVILSEKIKTSKIMPQVEQIPESLPENAEKLKEHADSKIVTEKEIVFKEVSDETLCSEEKSPIAVSSVKNLIHLGTSEIQNVYLEMKKQIKTNQGISDGPGTSEDLVEYAEISKDCSEYLVPSKVKKLVQKNVENSKRIHENLENSELLTVKKVVNCSEQTYQESSSEEKQLEVKELANNYSESQEVHQYDKPEKIATKVLNSDLEETDPINEQLKVSKPVKMLDQCVLAMIESEKELTTTKKVDEILESTQALANSTLKSSPSSDEVVTPKKRAGRPAKSTMMPQDYREPSPKKRTVRRSSSSHDFMSDESESSPEKLADTASTRRSGRTHKPTEKLKEFICTKGNQLTLLGTAGTTTTEGLQTNVLESNDEIKTSKSVSTHGPKSFDARSMEPKSLSIEDTVENKVNEKIKKDKSSKDEITEPPAKRRRGRPPKISSPSKGSSPSKHGVLEAEMEELKSPVELSTKSTRIRRGPVLFDAEMEEIASSLELSSKSTKIRRGRPPKRSSSLESVDSKLKTGINDEETVGNPFSSRERRPIKSSVAIPNQDDVNHIKPSRRGRPKAVKRGRGRPPKIPVVSPERDEQLCAKVEETKPKVEETKPIKDTIQKIVRSKNKDAKRRGEEKPIKDAIHNIVRSKATEERTKDTIKKIDQVKQFDEKIEEKVTVKKKEKIKKIVQNKTGEEKKDKGSVKKIVQNKVRKEKPLIKNTIQKIVQSKSSGKTKPTSVKEHKNKEEIKNVHVVTAKKDSPATPGAAKDNIIVCNVTNTTPVPATVTAPIPSTNSQTQEAQSSGVVTSIPPPPPPVEEPVKKTKRTQLYTPDQRAEMARLCQEMGPTKSAREMSKRLNRHVSESTMRSVKKAWDRQNPGVLAAQVGQQGVKPSTSLEMKGEVKRSSPYCQEPPKYLSTIISSLKEEDIIRLKNHISKKGSQYSSKFLEALNSIKLPSEEKKMEESSRENSAIKDPVQKVCESGVQENNDSSSSSDDSSSDDSSSGSSSDDDSSSGESSSDESSSSDEEDDNDDNSHKKPKVEAVKKLPINVKKLPINVKKLPIKNSKENKSSVENEKVLEERDISQLVKPLEEDSEKESGNDSSNGESSSSDSSSDDSSSDDSSSSEDSSSDESSSDDSSDEEDEKDHKQEAGDKAEDDENKDASISEMDDEVVESASEEKTDFIDSASSLPTPPIDQPNVDGDDNNSGEEDGDDNSDSDTDDAENSDNSDEEVEEKEENEVAKEDKVAASYLVAINESSLPENEVNDCHDPNTELSESSGSLEGEHTNSQNNIESHIENIDDTSKTYDQDIDHGNIPQGNISAVADNDLICESKGKTSVNTEKECIEECKVIGKSAITNKRSRRKKLESFVEDSDVSIQESTCKSNVSNTQVADSSEREAKIIMFSGQDNSTSFFPTPPSEDSQEFAFPKSTTESELGESNIGSISGISEKSQKQVFTKKRKKTDDDHKESDTTSRGPETSDVNMSNSDSVQSAVIVPTSSAGDAPESSRKTLKLEQTVNANNEGKAGTDPLERSVVNRNTACSITQNSQEPVDTSIQQKLQTKDLESATIESVRKAKKCKLNDNKEAKFEIESFSEETNKDISIRSILKSPKMVEEVKKKTKRPGHDVMKDIWKTGRKRRNKNNSPKKGSLNVPAQSTVKKSSVKSEYSEEKSIYGPFNWGNFLSENKLIAAPPNCFKQHSSPPENKFEVGMKLESVDPRNVSSTCIATVRMTSGPSINLQLDGEDSMNNFWKLVDSQDIHSIGYCESNNGIIVPPFGFTKDISSWTRFRKRSLQNAIYAPAEVFQQEPPTPPGNLFKNGMMLEAVDRKNTDYICAATVGAIEGDNIQIVCDVWYGKFDYWCRYDSREIFPVGWCAKTKQVLQLPKHLYDDDDEDEAVQKANREEKVKTKDTETTLLKKEKDFKVIEEKSTEARSSRRSDSKRVTVQVITNAPLAVAVASAANETEGLDLKRRKKKEVKDVMQQKNDVNSAATTRRGRSGRGEEEEQQMNSSPTFKSTEKTPTNASSDTIHKEDVISPRKKESKFC